MRRRAAIIIATSVLAVAGVVTGLVVWLSGPSYDETVKGCQKALVAQYKADGEGKPSACDGVKKGDYDALVLNAAMGDLGWLDDEGRFDENEMLDSVTETP